METKNDIMLALLRGTETETVKWIHHDANLARGEPEGPAASSVLDEDAHHALE